MQYQLIQDTLTYLMNGVAISGVLAAGTTIVYQYWTQERLQPRTSTVLEPKKLQPERIELTQLQQQLSFTQEQLQQAQQELAQSHQHKLQLQSYLDAVKFELQKAQQKEHQYQIEFNQLQQNLSSTEEELQKTQQDLNSTKEGLQGFVNQMFGLDWAAKTRLKELFSNKEVSQQPTFN